MNMVFILTAAAITACASEDQNQDPPSTIVNAQDVPLDGRGPYFIRSSCGACHSEGSRGFGLVLLLAIVLADGITASPDQSELPIGHTERQGLTAGAMTPLTAPMVPDVLVSIRIGPPVFGRGYIEAIDDAEILRVAAEQAQRTDAIHGVVPRATFASVPSGDGFSSYQTGDTVIGRFGVKARVATLDDFAADAFQGDMGMTTPMRPVEVARPDGLTDDDRPGVDLDQEHVDKVAFYLRRIAIPKRVGLTDRGAALLAQVQCAACHVPAQHTRADLSRIHNYEP